MPEHPKVLVREKIPSRFQDILKHVVVLIERGDESTTIESDDLLQDDARDYYGGLLDSEKQLFFFVFYPEPFDEEAAKDPAYYSTEWMFNLSKPQIAAIASGEIIEIDMWRCPSGDCANRFNTPDGACHLCDS